MKKFFCYFLTSCFIVLASEYKEFALEDKIADPDLSFVVTFDNKDLNADKALGATEPLTLADTSLLLRGLIGFDSNGAFKPETGEDLKFDAYKNADPHEGTLSLWVSALDYDPSQELTEGKKRGNIALAHLWFQEGERHIYFQLYEFADTVYFDWRNSEEPHGWGSVGRVQFSRAEIKQGQWHQIVATWKDNLLNLYLNGKLLDSVFLPEKYKKTVDLKPESKVSFIGVKSRFYEDKHSYAVGIDDYKIYKRALTALEISNQYNILLKDATAAEIKAYSITANGVNIGWNDPIDKLELEFDFSALKENLKKELLAGKLPLDYELIAPSGKIIKKGKWFFKELQETKMLDSLTETGTYLLKTSLADEKVEEKIERPDFSWSGNGIGDEDIVPELWKDFAVKGRDVTLWNRSYHFDKGPLPVKINAYGEALLLESPKLLIDDYEIIWKTGKTERNNCSVIFTGTGKSKDFSIDYRTKIEFDGLIKFNFTIKGEPEISSMKLTWRCRPELCTYLMTPTLQESGGPEFSFMYPNADSRHKQLWFASEGKGGFCYSMQNDANWIYEPQGKVFFANQNTGECEVRMICKKQRLPKDTPYEALFIATPTRPLPNINRMLCFDSGRGTYGFLNAGGDGGLAGVFSFTPDKKAFPLKVSSARPYSYSVYGAANALTTLEPEAIYLRKYWEIPGAYSYKMPYHKLQDDGTKEKIYGFSISACNTGIINDYYLDGIDKLFKHEYGDRIWQIYYDLCGNNLCRNALHGCRYKDKFGREVSTYNLLSKRKLIERTVRYCHANGRTVMLHAQRDFNPILQGMADYWFPGEQHSSILRRNPYAYVDEISDALYRSEYNRDVLGIGVIFLPSLGQANRANSREPAYPYTRAMLMMLQMHDIETAMSWAARVPCYKLWDILEKYSFEKAALKVNLYYEQKEVLSSNPAVRVTWYETGDNHKLLMLGNKDVFEQTSTIDLTALSKESLLACEEFEDREFEIKNGTFSITVPPRDMRIVAFPPKKFYPYKEDFFRSWGFWKSEGSDAQYRHERDFGLNDSFCMRLINGEKTGSLTKTVPIVPGRRYVLSIWCLSEKDANARIAVQARKGGIMLGIVGKRVNEPVKANGQWQQVKLEYAVPTTGKWAESDYFLITMGTDPNNTMAFDDFYMEEFED